MHMLAQGQERGYICLHSAQRKVLTNGTGDGGPMINNKGNDRVLHPILYYYNLKIRDIV